MTVNMTKGPDDDPPPEDPTPLSKVVGKTKPAEIDLSKPIRPEWLRDPLTFRTTVRNFTKRNGWRAIHWTFWLPAIVAKLAMYAPRGFWRLGQMAWSYLYDWDSAQLRAAHAGNKETADYQKAAGIRRHNLRARWLVATGCLMVTLVPALAWTFPSVLSWIIGAVVGLWIVHIIPGRKIEELFIAAIVAIVIGLSLPKGLAYIPQPPGWLLWTGALVGYLVVGYVGRNLERELVSSTELGNGVVIPIHAPMVREALTQLGIAAINQAVKEGGLETIRVLMDAHRSGPGVQIDLEIPTAAAEVIKRREKLAAALRRELGCVWPKVGRRHAGHLSLYVSDQPMGEQEQNPWPLAEAMRPIDLFERQPLFTSQLGAWLSSVLMFASVVIGAVPRMGKTFIVRQLGLVFAMDVRSRLYLLDGKGTGDLNALKSCARFISRGESGEEVEERVLPMLRGLRAELQRRAKVINDLPDEDVPDSKVTSALADRRSLGLYPIGLFMDETQAYFLYGSDTNKHDKRVRAEIIEIVTDLVKRGPALGFVIVLATQNVNDRTIPRDISLNAIIRIALKVADHTANDQILGTGSYGRGIDATAFSREDRGCIWLAGETSNPEICRSVSGLNVPAVRELAARAHAWRAAADQLDGEAAGEHQQPEYQPDLLDDVHVVMDRHRGGPLSLKQLVPELAEMRPHVYERWTTDTLGSALRDKGVRLGTVRPLGEEITARGVKWDDLQAARMPDDEDDD